MPKNLLVADDSITIRKVIGMVLSTHDIQITSVDNGLDAITKAKELRPDLVLADVLMPGKSGYEVCEALKSDPDTQQIPVLLLAGTFEPFDESRAQSAHADAHLTKPFESQALIDKVRALLGLPPADGQPKSWVTRPSTPAAAPAPAPTPAIVAPPAAPVPPAQPLAAAAPPRVPAPAARGPVAVAPQGHPAFPRPPGPGFPPPPRPGAAPGLPRPPGPGFPGAAGPVPPRAAPPGPLANPGMAPPRGMMPNPGMPPAPQMPRMPNPGMPNVPPPGMARPGPMPPGAAPGMRPMPMPGMRPPGPAAFPRPPGASPLPAPGGARGRDPFGLGAPAGPGAPVPRPGALPPRGPMPQAPRPAMPPPQQQMAPEAMLRQALSMASKETIEKVVWEVVPQLAETIIREELDRLIKEREGKS